ncbi:MULTISPECIES: hypothetical protein [Metabacillus]|uniref:hypothetical protein n=1 Tax=Metabacillus TaxID=2675233 RepID=UPI000C80D3FC|nr:MULTISPECIES: hypothetical protein [Metabacillus]MCM3443580.1 hypothetical protein [Metabacillus halosaccharovorans]PMC34259.1 hypothetical protein CJ195_24390 [Bacillus sp. UMB0899]
MITIFALVTITTVVVVFTFTNNTLVNSINTVHSTDIQLLTSDPENTVVLFKEKNSNHVILNEYKSLMGYFWYSKEGEEAIVADAKDGRVPFTIRVSKIEGVGNVFWGYIDSNEADKIVINVKKGEQQFSIKKDLNGQGFLFYPPTMYNNNDFYDEKWQIEGYVLNESNEVVEYY